MAFKMYGKTPMVKALIGKQKNLPQHLQDAIEGSPAQNYKDGYYNSSNKQKVENSSSDMDKEAADEDAKMIEIAKKRGYTMKRVEQPDGTFKVVKVKVDKETGKPIEQYGLYAEK